MIELVREVIRARVEAGMQVRMAILFGSLARGEASAGSDIDLAIEGAADPEGVARTLSLALEREVDVVRLESAPIPLLRQLLRDGICVFERQEGDHALWRSKALSLLELDGPAYDRMRDAFLARLAERSSRG